MKTPPTAMSEPSRRVTVAGIAGGPKGINRSNRPGIRTGGRQSLGGSRGIVTSPNRKPIAGKRGRR